MRKRRRLANKMTIMVCAVLLAVSAFFYAPMEVDASTVTSYFDTFNFNQFPNSLMQQNIPCSLLDSSFDNDTYYSIRFRVNYEFSFDNYVRHLRDFVLSYSGRVLYSTSVLGDSSNNFNGSFEFTSIGRGYDFKNNYLNYYLRALIDDVSVFDLACDIRFDFEIIDFTVLSGEESATYQQGYNAGYSVGEEVGESNGYSSGYSDGYEAGEQSGYDSGFQAGSDSVDTQSYYDAGYSAGYDVGYSTGYDTGYDEGYDAGWSAYEAQMDKWGADTSDYPLKLSSGNTNAYFSVHVGSDIPFNYRDSDHWVSSAEYNSNHTYKYVINFSNIDEGLDSDILYDYWDIFLNVGGIEYNITPFQDMSVSVFIPGDRISTSYSFDWVLYNCANYVADDSNLAYLYVDYDFAIYDMGPSGDTQNHIANQTDQLTNGYDDSKGNTVNSNLSTGLNDYETAENSLFATATTGMRDFTFFDFESVPSMITGMSFIGSIMGSWFNQAGGASGVGIVLSILFSVILVAMVLGLYRWYQSRGGKD